MYVSFLHASDVGRDFKFLFEEAIDTWVKDQNRWAELVKRLMEQPLQNIDYTLPRGTLTTGK